VDREAGSVRVLLVHEQNGRYSRDDLEALAERTGAPSLGGFLSDPFHWLAPFAAGPGLRRGRAVELPSLASIDGWARRLMTRDGRVARRYLARRGISSEVIETARIGWDGKRLTFPMFHESELVGFKTRLPRAGAQLRSVPGAGRPWPLYPGSREPWRDEGWVLLVAGELDALAGLSVGLPAASVTCGAGTWRDEWTHDLAGLSVVVCFDNNEQQWARERVAGLGAAGVVAHRLDLRTLGLDTPKGDLNDYLTGGGDPARLRRPRRRVVWRRRSAA
jgi:hypothetical protein